MLKGTVKFFSDIQEYGFITSEISNQEIFVYASGLIDNIQKNDQVIYNIAFDLDGAYAINVKLA
ncbi:cold-shock protein [Aureibacter tunicatorum]|uniref:CspA family cold shock protein n=1 Tax=Aureibacter tunicatorum TaxID=866807 RepID=A0AAE3XP67_9BACT|nr:cold shock domain-containing protein [Aureibacter tunicatorum]MDR6241521.1 CspA family cold shock protein [Aureibacter tunicatorum]BDD07021.1 hypothetical protein AUTU_45040 [Aureibacter tunicatorum]